VALALRLAGLGRWSLFGDEAFSLESAEKFGSAAARAGERAFPIFFALERMALEAGRALMGDAAFRAHPEFVARIVPALAGAAAALAAFTAARGVLGRRERHVLAALLTFSPWLLYWSQSVRFYTLLVSLTTAAAFTLVRAEEERSLPRALLGTVWLALAILTNPTATFVLVGHLLAVLLLWLLHWRRPSRASIPPLVLVALAAAVSAWKWQLVEQTVGFKLNERGDAVGSLGDLLKGIGYNVGPAILVLGFAGIPALVR